MGRKESSSARLFHNINLYLFIISEKFRSTWYLEIQAGRVDKSNLLSVILCKDSPFLNIFISVFSGSQLVTILLKKKISREPFSRYQNKCLKASERFITHKNPIFFKYVHSPNLKLNVPYRNFCNIIYTYT